jgi:hypothetical protein
MVKKMIAIVGLGEQKKDKLTFVLNLRVRVWLTFSSVIHRTLIFISVQLLLLRLYQRQMFHLLPSILNEIWKLTRVGILTEYLPIVLKWFLLHH